MQWFSRQIGKFLKTVDPPALSAMRRHAWPGNIRELQNVMERAVILSKDVIRLGALPSEMLRRPEPENMDSREMLKCAEKEIIGKALKNSGGNRRLAAEERGMSRRTLQYKLKEFGLLDEP